MLQTFVKTPALWDNAGNCQDERAQDLAQVRQKIAAGLEQLDRGAGLDGEETFAQLLSQLDNEDDRS
jgi:hypothetical protein